jgi:hypothetical protein
VNIILNIKQQSKINEIIEMKRILTQNRGVKCDHSMDFLSMIALLYFCH